ncbi:4-hydroxy-tetrahydrodipicolinate reductase [bacterium]|nr:4-hydroxy-tetrahydrodipicolinate reductase [bacterium]
MIKVGIAGAAGKMGRALVRAVVEHPELSLSAAWDRKDHPSIGQDAGVLAGLVAAYVVVGDSAAAAIAKSEIVIDFTAPDATVAIVRHAVETGCALIVGTTGMTSEQLTMLQKAGEKIAVVYATNFSTGVNVLWALAEQAAGILGEAYDAEIIESHHNLKKDAPSGTAVTLLEAIARGKGLDPQKSAIHGRVGMPGVRRKEEIGVHAVRAGDIVGEHIALFAGPGERIELKHQAHSRDVFARGAVRAATWVKKQDPGFYHMSDVLGIKTK